MTPPFDHFDPPEGNCHWACPRTGLDAKTKRKNPCLCRGSKPVRTARSQSYSSSHKIITNKNVKTYCQYILMQYNWTHDRRQGYKKLYVMQQKVLSFC